MNGPIRDEWLPPIKELGEWFDEMRKRLKNNPPILHPIVENFKNFVLNNAGIYQVVNEMIDTASDPKVCVLCTHVLTSSYQWIDSRKTLLKCSICLT